MLVIDNLSVRVAGRLLIEEAAVQIPAAARVGLVGRNGTGKTTLFRVIAGELAPEQGAIVVPRKTRIGRLAQEAPDGPQSLIDMVLAADTERTALLAEAEHADNPHRIAEIQTRLADIGAYAAPARAAGILAGLGFSADEQLKACASFSGGWRMRVALAAILFSAPDLLLLDEPTNYLDLEGTLWLQDFLARYPHTVMIISHDRDLLERGRLDPASRSRQAHALSRRLFVVRPPTRGTADPRRQARAGAGRRAQADRGLRRPLPRQGDQGAAGAVAPENARPARADHGDRRGYGAADRVSAARETALAADHRVRRRCGRL